MIQMTYGGSGYSPGHGNASLNPIRDRALVGLVCWLDLPLLAWWLRVGFGYQYRWSPFPLGRLAIDKDL